MYHVYDVILSRLCGIIMAAMVDTVSLGEMSGT
jgi:hypothetical protein